MTGGGFEAALRAAQQGDARAFADLWRATNPAVTRYLEVVAPGRAGDLACESWVAALRRLSELEPTQTAWRSLVLGAAHEKADEEHGREAWSLSHFETADDLSWSALADLEVGAGLRPGSAVEPAPSEHDDEWDAAVIGLPADPVDEAVEALRALPAEQAEVMALRLAGGLGAAETATVLATAPEAVEALDRQSREALGGDDATEAIGRDLAAPARDAELADEPVVLTLYRAAFPRDLRVATPARAAAPTATVIPLRRAGRVGIGTVAASAMVFGFGALSAAAYTGGLPDPVQEVMHRVIGAPAPVAPAETVAAPPQATSTPSTATTGGVGVPVPPSFRSLVTAAPGTPSAVASAAPALCAAWAAESARGTLAADSPAFRQLVAVVGSAVRVPSVCATVATPTPSPTTTVPATTDAGPTTPVLPEPTTTGTPTEVVPPPTSDPTTTPEPTTSTPEPTTTTTESPEPSPAPSPEPTPEPTLSESTDAASTDAASTDAGATDRGNGRGNGQGQGGQPAGPAPTSDSGNSNGSGKVKDKDKDHKTG